MSRSAEPPDDFSPSRDQCHAMLLSLLPRGRAHGTHEAAGDRAASVLKSFWYAVAGSWHALENAVTATLDEWSCGSADKDLDLWFADYGLPDECDPAGDDLCAKVRAAGGLSIEYYEGIAADIGIVAEMRFLKGDPDDPDHPGVRATLFVEIDSEASFDEPLAYVGQMRVGLQQLGTGDIGRLECILERILPAHLGLIVEVV